MELHSYNNLLKDLKIDIQLGLVSYLTKSNEFTPLEEGLKILKESKGMLDTALVANSKEELNAINEYIISLGFPKNQISSFN